jgi:PKD repeat protein
VLLPSSPSSSAGGSAATASVNATADQTTLAAVTLGLTASAAPSAYEWAVNGDAFTGSTGATPTFIPTQPGTYTVTCTATIGGASVVATPDTFLVGDGLLPIREGATGTVVDTL